MMITNLAVFLTIQFFLLPIFVFADHMHQLLLSQEVPPRRWQQHQKQIANTDSQTIYYRVYKKTQWKVNDDQ